MLAATVGMVCQLLVIVCLILDRRTERREHAALVADLCQRIQAPDVAVIAHEAQTREMRAPQPPGLDDDAGYWRSKDDLAESLP